MSAPCHRDAQERRVTGRAVNNVNRFSDMTVLRKDEIRGKGKQVSLDWVRGDDSSGIGKGLMVLFYEAQVVEIIDHQSLSFAQAFGRCVTEPVQTFQTGAVAQMKARDRVDRLSTRCLGANVIEGREVEDDGTKRAPESRVQVPVLRLKWRQGGRIKVRKSGRLRIGGYLFEPMRKPWCRRQGHKVFQGWHVS